MRQLWEEAGQTRSVVHTHATGFYHQGLCTQNAIQKVSPCSPPNYSLVYICSQRRSPYTPCEGQCTLRHYIAGISLEDICFVTLQRRGDLRHKPEPKGPSSGAAVPTHLAGIVMVCLATLDHRWEDLGEGLLAQQSSSVGGKGARGL